MLAALQPLHVRGRDVIFRARARKGVEQGERGKLAFYSIGPRRRHSFQMVQRADRHRDAVCRVIGEGQRRAAVLAEAALGIPHLTIHFGFMERLNIPKHLQEASEQRILPFHLDLDCALYFIEHIALAALPGRAARLFAWQKRLFIMMFTNTVATFSALEFLKLPKERTVTIGTYAEL